MNGVDRQEEGTLAQRDRPHPPPYPWGDCYTVQVGRRCQAQDAPRAALHGRTQSWERGHRGKVLVGHPRRVLARSGLRWGEGPGGRRSRGARGRERARVLGGEGRRRRGGGAAPLSPGAGPRGPAPRRTPRRAAAGAAV